MNPTLDGRAVLVTGAGSGIGRATALEVAARGGAVAVVDRDTDGVDATVALVAAAGGHAVPTPADVSDEDAVRDAVARAVAELGRLDGVGDRGRDLRRPGPAAVGRRHARRRSTARWP